MIDPTMAKALEGLADDIEPYVDRYSFSVVIVALEIIASQKAEHRRMTYGEDDATADALDALITPLARAELDEIRHEL